jgi:hypothetical protein
MQNLWSSLSVLFRGTKVAKHSFYSIGTKTMFGSVLEQFANLWHVKKCKSCISGLNAQFRGAKVVKYPFYSIGTKMMFGCVLEHFANLWHVKDAKLEFEPECTISVPKLWSIHSTPLDPNWCLGLFWEHFAILWHVKDAKLVIDPKCTISGYQSCEASILLHWTQNGVWSVSKHFANLRHEKTWKLVFVPERTISGYQSCEACIWCLGVFRSILLTFWCNEVVRHPFYSIGTKIMFGGVSERFANIWHVQVALLVFEPECIISRPNLWSIHSTPFDANWCLGVFGSSSLTFDT